MGWKMNRMQILLSLAMDILEIPIDPRNHREICNALYLAERRNIHVSPSRIDFNFESRYAYSKFISGDSGAPSQSLALDIDEIINYRCETLESEIANYQLDSLSIKRLEKLRGDIERRGMKTLLAELVEAA